MNMASDALPAPGLICPVCGAPLALQSERCERCGASIQQMPGVTIEAVHLPREVVLQEESPPATSRPTTLQDGISEVVPASEVVPPAEVIPATIEPDAFAATLPDLDLPLPPESEAAPEAQLSVTEGPEPRPRLRRPRFRIRFPKSAGAALLKWMPWLVGIGGLIALIALAVTTPSWGSIATRAGITLLIVGLCAGLLIWFFYRLHQRWTRRRWPISAASLLLVGLLGIVFAPSIHTLQGHVLEGQGSYQRAIEEYAASGEHSPNGQDIGRAYLEWGQRDLRAQDYAMAVQHLEAAAETYSATTAARSAREPLGTALLRWGRQLAIQEDYQQAIQQFAHLRQRYADTEAARQAQNSQDEPGAYYTWGQLLQAHRQFQQALAQFQAVGKLFPDGSYAALAYNGAAGDLYAWGLALAQQAQYAQAIAAYQQAISQYGQAPAAQQAQQALNAPQAVKGRLIFASGPPDAHVIIRLSSSWSAGPNGYVQGGFVYETRTDARGNFTFPSVAPGRYLIDWQEGSAFTTLLHQGTYNPLYIADVEPLRGVTLNDIQVEQ